MVFPADADDGAEQTAALHAHRVYGEPIRDATEDDIAADVARRAHGVRHLSLVQTRLNVAR